MMSAAVDCMAGAMDTWIDGAIGGTLVTLEVHEGLEARSRLWLMAVPWTIMGTGSYPTTRARPPCHMHRRPVPRGEVKHTAHGMPSAVRAHDRGGRTCAFARPAPVNCKLHDYISSLAPKPENQLDQLFESP